MLIVQFTCRPHAHKISHKTLRWATLTVSTCPTKLFSWSKVNLLLTQLQCQTAPTASTKQPRPILRLLFSVSRLHYKVCDNNKTDPVANASPLR